MPGGRTHQSRRDRGGCIGSGGAAGVPASCIYLKVRFEDAHPLSKLLARPARGLSLALARVEHDNAIRESACLTLHSRPAAPIRNGE